MKFQRVGFIVGNELIAQFDVYGEGVGVSSFQFASPLREPDIYLRLLTVRIRAQVLFLESIARVVHGLVSVVPHDDIYPKVIFSLFLELELYVILPLTHKLLILILERVGEVVFQGWFLFQIKIDPVLFFFPEIFPFDLGYVTTFFCAYRKVPAVAQLLLVTALAVGVGDVGAVAARTGDGEPGIADGLVGSLFIRPAVNQGLVLAAASLLFEPGVEDDIVCYIVTGTVGVLRLVVGS